jgi:hypothetical protein
MTAKRAQIVISFAAFALIGAAALISMRGGDVGCKATTPGSIAAVLNCP